MADLTSTPTETVLCCDCFSDRRRFATPVDPLAAKSMLVSTLGKIERYRIFNVFIVKIILFESVSVLFCVFHTSFGTRSYGKIVRLFNWSTGEKNSALTPGIVNINYAPGAVVTHQTWMLFLASSMRQCMEKGSIESSPNTINLSCLLGLLCRSKWPTWLIWKVLRAIGRFVTRSQQLCSKLFLLPDIEISSFSLSCPLLQCFNRQASKRNNMAKERVANVSLCVVELHVTYTKCPPLDITVIINFFLATKIFLWRPFCNCRWPKGDFLKKWAWSADYYAFFFLCAQIMRFHVHT